MKKLGELMMILDLHRQGVKIAVIARQLGVDRKTVRKYIARGVEVPTYGPRQPRERLLDPHIDYLRARLEAYPGLSAQRLARELGDRGFRGGYSTVGDTVLEAVLGMVVERSCGTTVYRWPEGCVLTVATTWKRLVEQLTMLLSVADAVWAEFRSSAGKSRICLGKHRINLVKLGLREHRRGNHPTKSHNFFIRITARDANILLFPVKSVSPS